MYGSREVYLMDGASTQLLRCILWAMIHIGMAPELQYASGR